MDTPRRNRPRLCPSAFRLAPHSAFTLVELLVVITIIGILASLITVAAAGALKRARQTAIKVELDQIAGALETYKGQTNAYPPNLQTDFAASNPVLDSNQVLNDLQRHMQQISGRSSEESDLARVLTGFAPAGPNKARYSGALPGGVTADEALVFWLSGFSSDPVHPISGEGGPSYLASQGANDPVDSRRWVYPFVVSRLGPRDPATGYFNGRFIEFPDPRYPTDNTMRRRINFWQYLPPKSIRPYLYFDTSRHPAAVVFGNAIIGPYHPPAATQPTGAALHIHAVTKINPVYRDDQAGNIPPIVFVNPEKFQILHCGIDDFWGAEEGVGFEMMSAHGVTEFLNAAAAERPENYLLYPTGPFTGDIADTIVNFTTGTLEDAQQ